MNKTLPMPHLPNETGEKPLRIDPNNPIIPQLEKFRPGKNVTFTAIEHLTKAKYIRAFFHEEIIRISQTEPGEVNPAEIAYNNLLYICNYNKKWEQIILKKWKSILKDYIGTIQKVK